MLFKNIKEAIVLNKKKIEQEGRKFYYSPQTTIGTLTLLTILFAFSTYTFLFLHSDNFFIGIGILSGALWGYSIVNMFHKVIFKNPIFIVNGDKLYYTKMGRWFDLNECMIYEAAATKGNFAGTLVIEYDNSPNQFLKNRILENLWYIEYDDEFIQLINIYFKKEKVLL